MANYTKTTDFAAKDTLPGGDTNKVVRGSEFETEFDAISTAIATKADIAGPTFTGTVTIPTADINGGNIDGTVIGASSAAAGTFSDLTATTADINAGTIDNAVIGGSTAVAGTFTNLTASGTVNFNGATISNLGTITTANLDGGTIDNAVIGGSTAAAGSFTTVAASSSITVGGTAVLTSVAFSNIDAGAITTSSETFADSDTQIPTNAAVKDHVEAVIPTLSVTESSVTAHQAALAITASQLSDVTSTAAELNLVDGSTADTVVNSKAVIYGAAGQITANELDVDNIQIDANAVKSTNTNGNIQLFPNGTGFTELYGNTNAGAIRFNCESNSHGVTLKGPPHSAGATYSLELPNSDGTAGQVLQTNGSGKLSFADTAGGATLEATASGALANGDTVIVNANGTVSAVAGTVVTEAAGTAVTFESAVTNYIASAYDANAQKIVIVYEDAGNNSYGTAVVGTVSGTSISFGTPVVFKSGGVEHCAIAYDANAQKMLIGFKATQDSNHGKAIVGTVSGTSISFGDEATIRAHNTDEISITYDSTAQKCLVAYRQRYNYYGEAKVATISGTGVSFGSETVFNAGNTTYIRSAYDSNENRHVIVYTDSGNSNYGTAIVGTVSGTSVSFGSEVVYKSARVEYTGVAYDANAQKVVLAYRDYTNSFYGTALVGTVSSTGISFGATTVYESARSDYNEIVYNSNLQKVVIAYADQGDSYKGTVVVGTISGTGISFTDPFVFETGNSAYITPVYDSNSQKVVISLKDQNDSDYGKSVVYTTPSTSTNLTSENYIGISDAAYSDGATATVQIVGSVDDAQSSLTPGQQYFVQLDGSLGTTAADPSVFAGTAVAATKIIVKG